MGRLFAPVFQSFLLIAFAGGSALASPQSTLFACQSAVGSEGPTYVREVSKALSSCLQHVSTELVKKGLPSPAAAAPACVTALRKINNATDPQRTLAAKFAAKVSAKCDPSSRGVEHSLADILGSGAGVPTALDAADLNEWCSAFGGDGSIDSVEEWIDCLIAANTCYARAAVAGHYPRTLEWLDAVRPSITAIQPVPSDALAALDETTSAIEGAVDDNLPEIRCGFVPFSAGHGCVASGQCASGICVDGVCCNTGCTGTCLACNVAGSAGTCTNVPALTQDAPTCTGANACDGAGSCLANNGAACTSASQCLSSYCVDGLCCNSACTGTCLACNVSGNAGTCTAVAAVTQDPPTCTGTKACDGAGTCLSNNGAACTGASECLSGFCVDGVCCNAACTATCLACNVSGSAGTCVNVAASAQDPPTCTGTNACNGAGVCLGNNGAACTAASQCLSGFCADGVCCNAACTGTCLACNVSGSAGTCTNVPAFTQDPPGCTGTSACDGNGACLSNNGVACASNSQCASGFCVDGVCCDSSCQGTCMACNVSGSAGTCTAVAAFTQDPPGCTGTNACNGAGICRSDNGAACAFGSQCVSGFCVDGVCCNSACSGTCMACNLSGSAGTCTAVAAFAQDPNSCTGTSACNGAGSCLSNNSVACASASQCLSGNCVDGVCCNSTCSGTCMACNVSGSAGTCANVPASTQDSPGCTGTNACNGAGSCLSDNGVACASASQCASGFCVDGVCCNSTCSGTCMACNVSGSAGTCANVPTLTDDPPTCTSPRLCNSGLCLLGPGSACFSPNECASKSCVVGVCQ